MSGRRGGRKGAGLMAPIKGGKLNKSKIMRPDKEQHTVANILKKNAKNVKKSKAKNSKLNKANSNKSKNKKGNRKKGKFRAPKGKGKKIPPKKRKKGGKKGKNKDNDTEQQSDMDDIEHKQPEIDPYELLKQTDPNALIRMFLHKLVEYPFVTQYLGQFGDQLQSNMINFAQDMILPTLMSLDNVQKFKSIINDRKLIYLLRQSFIRWLLIHRGQMKLLFKRKGDENAKNKLKYNIVVTKNHIIQKLSSTLTRNSNDLKDIISKLDTKTKLAYFHYLKSDIKNPFLAQLMTPIPGHLLSNTKCNVPSLSGKMPNVEEKKDDPNAIIHEIVGHDNEQKEDDEKVHEEVEQPIDDAKVDVAEQKAEVKVEDVEYDNMQIQRKLHGLFDGYKDCVLLSEKQILVDILKTQYKLIQNAIDDYGKIRWMDAPIDHGHIRLMQRELIRDHQQIIKKCQLIENDYKKKLMQNITEVNKMRRELKKRKEIYLDLIENKCYRFLKEKLSAIHEEIERKKQAIALHEKKRENYLNHAKESLKNEQNMRKGVKLVNDTYHKYLRQLTRSKIEYAVIDNKLSQDQFYTLQEKLNNLRNKNDRYWYWYKKEKEIYTKSIKTFSRMNRFFKKIETFLVNEYGEHSEELMLFKRDYYVHVLANNVDKKELNNEFNKEIFEKKKISDIEIVYNMKKKDIKLPAANISVVNRLYKQLKPDVISERVMMSHHNHERSQSDDHDESGMFVNNAIKRHQDEYGDDVMMDDEKEDGAEHNMNVHVNDSDDEEEYVEEKKEHSGYIKTNDDDIFANVNMEEPHDEMDNEMDNDNEMDDVDKYAEFDDDELDDMEMQDEIDDDEYDIDEQQNEDEDDDDEDNDNENDMSYEQVIQSASHARLSENENMIMDKTDMMSRESTEDNNNETEAQFLLVAEKSAKSKGKRNTQNVWKGKVESTVFYGDGDNVNQDISAGPHIAKHYSVGENVLQNVQELAYEDSTPYQQDEYEYEEEEAYDENRPSSTIFKNEDVEQDDDDEPQFFNEPQFFAENKNENDDDDEQDMKEQQPQQNDDDNDNDEYEYKIKLRDNNNNKHDKAQNSLSVSGFGQINTSFGYDTPPLNSNDNGFDIPPPPPPDVDTPVQQDNDNEYEYDDNEYDNDNVNEQEEDDDDEEYEYDDNMEHNMVQDDDMGNMSFESDDDDDDDSSYVDSDEED